MAQQVVGKIPDFTGESSPEVVQEEVKEIPAEEVVEPEKETPEPPAEKPDETPSPIVDTAPLPVDNSQDLEKAVTGLQQERVKLLKEISELKGQRREIKEDQLARVDKQIDELKDIHPEDVAVVEKILRGKGYVTKEEADRMFYESVKQTELEKFLDKYPEYKPENDPNDTNWNSLQREIGYYKIPSNPKQITEVLERAHRMIVKVPSGPSIPVQKRQIQVASHGSGGAQRPSPSGKTLDPEKVAMLKQGGFNDEDIRSMESRLQ